ncbi:hypothetical protein SKAU_G00112720 [Synaphobranchus kaupii]|uniref:Uncharacterized protein n=1 Tax=Synaphobranchus kaupii TaxID=118154 RepID=A0A9Q1G0H4_SYNKA|nr:hypothetical protein SKAU_G00112720 [Synaphobranchus kaupii]
MLGTPSVPKSPGHQETDLPLHCIPLILASTHKQSLRCFCIHRSHSHTLCVTLRVLCTIQRNSDSRRGMLARGMPRAAFRNVLRSGHPVVRTPRRHGGVSRSEGVSGRRVSWLTASEARQPARFRESASPWQSAGGNASANAQGSDGLTAHRRANSLTAPRAGRDDLT